MNYVLNEDGSIKVGPNGQPLVKGADGKEYEIDAIGAQKKIDAIVVESNGRRTKLAETKTELETVTTERDTLKTSVDSIDDKNKIKIDELKEGINKTWEAKEKAWTDEKVKLEDDLFVEKVGNKFASSKVIANTVLPPKIALATYKGNFKPDGTAIDSNGTTIYSKSKPGEPADFDEAITSIIDASPDKDLIWKSKVGHDGSDSGSGDPGKQTGTKTSHASIKAGLDAREGKSA